MAAAAAHGLDSSDSVGHARGIPGSIGRLLSRDPVGRRPGGGGECGAGELQPGADLGRRESGGAILGAKFGEARHGLDFRGCWFWGIGSSQGPLHPLLPHLSLPSQRGSHHQPGPAPFLSSWAGWSASQLGTRWQASPPFRGLPCGLPGFNALLEQTGRAKAWHPHHPQSCTGDLVPNVHGCGVQGGKAFLRNMVAWGCYVD